MNETATRVSPNARGKVSDRTGYALAAGIGVLLAITGAFDTGYAPLWLRLVFWLTVMLSGALIGTSVTDGVHRWGLLARLPLLEGALIAVAISVPLTLLVSGASAVAFGVRSFSVVSLGYMFLLVLAVSIVMVAINYVLMAQHRAGMVETIELKRDDGTGPPMPTVVSNEDPASRFRDRLPIHLRAATLYAVASEDHYLRVYCAQGDALILFRLADALADLADVPGAQTHRSWWVAKDAVTRVERGAGKATLHLVNGVAAPVSRSFLPVLAQLGWR